MVQKDVLSYYSETNQQETTNSSATQIGTEVFTQQHAWLVADQELRLQELGQVCLKMVEMGLKIKQAKFYSHKRKLKMHLKIAKMSLLALIILGQFSQ